MPVGVYERTDEYKALMKKVVGPKTRARHEAARQEKILYINQTGKLACAKCKQEKPLSDFPKDSKRWCGHRAQCKECCKAYYAKKSKEYYHANKDKITPKRFWYYKKSVHGITKEEYLTTLHKQNGVCAICKKAPTKEPLCIDHNHDSGKFRGLLCRKCNVGLGSLGDSALICRVAAEYLEQRGSYGKT